MTLVVALASLCLISLIGWQSIARGAWTSNHLAVVAALAALASIGRVVLGGVPNVEPVTPIVVCVTIALGLRMGIAVGVLSVLCSNLVLGHGPWTLWQIVGYSAVAIVAHVVSRREPSTVELVSIAGLGAIVYELILTYASVTIFIQGGDATYLRSLVIGMPFIVVHVVAVSAMTAVIAQPVLQTLRRARRRLDASVIA
jgi:energy-coupling factor transport system substrate-specific component